MAEGHIESYLCVFVRVYQNRVQLITSSCIVGFENNFGTNDYNDKTMCRGQEPC